MASMLKKLFNVLALFAFLSLVCFVFVLFYNKNNTYYVAVGQEHFSKLIKGHEQQLWATTDVPRVSEETVEDPVNETLGPCPENPPKLVGPLWVGFNFKLTMDDVKREVSVQLREGGRYKPSECIALQKVAIIIPYRNRYEHLMQWLLFLHPILMRQQVDYGVYVINQDGEGVFNRAKLMNVGFAEALKEDNYDCFVFSDVDLIPMDDRNLYRCFDNPRHLAVAMDKFNFQLPYHTYFGGVSSLSKEQYLKINGFSNTFWGWGGEDDDIYNRIVFRGMSISRPDFMTGKYRMIRHTRDLHNEPNPENPNKLGQTQWTMNTDGFNSLQYTVKAIVKEPLYTFITVDIGSPNN